MTLFEPRAILVPLTDDQASNWPAWRELMLEHIKGAATEDHLRQIIDLNQEAFADCCVRGPNAYRAIDDALGKRRRQISAGMPWSDE
jgi:hypothetical protein